MDPSEIMKVPFDLDRLNIFAMFPVTLILLLALVKTPERIFSYILSLARLTILSYGLLGLCGAHIVENFKHSLLAALYLASLLSTTARTDILTGQIFDQLPFHDHSDLLKTSRLYGTLLGSIPFQILAILDRGIQVQRWPIPIILGVTYGYVLGTVVGLFLTYQERQAQRRRR